MTRISTQSPSWLQQIVFYRFQEWRLKLLWGLSYEASLLYLEGLQIR